MVKVQCLLHTLRADIDFHCARAQTPAGIIGVKVWFIRKGVAKCCYQRKLSTAKCMEKTAVKQLVAITSRSATLRTVTIK